MISVLFVAKNSVYKTLGVDCWDEERNALNWPGGNPIVAHPPCRLWSKWMRHFSKADSSEKELARFAVQQIRRWGGVLEHPACSLVWEEMKLPLPGRRDQYGLTIAIRQQWWGHKAEKATWLYICGCQELPPIPLVLGDPHVAYLWAHKGIKHPDMQRLSHKERLGTPPAFARWLIQTAERCQK